MKTQLETYYELEGIESATGFSSSLQYVSKRLWTWICDGIRNALTTNYDPIIRERSDKHGVSRWEIYDPLTNRKLTFDSVQLVQVWLEERHHRCDSGDRFISW